MLQTLFHPVVAEWFAARYGEPTEPQMRGWPAIAEGQDTLIAAPTGSGKTLAAFLIAIDHLFRQAASGRLLDETQILYVSPLKALANDVQKNLEEPLAAICALATERGLLLPGIRTAVRSGDTLAAERRAILKHPPHILVTTPESFYILLTAERSRKMLRTVQTVIVDEIHAVAGNKRGSHLSLSLERLDALVSEGGRRRPVRIGLSATVKPLNEIASFLVGHREAHSAPSLFAPGSGPAKPVLVHIPARRRLDVAVEVPPGELGPMATGEQWGDRFQRLAQLAEEHRSTLVFVSTRSMAERVAHHMREHLGNEAVAAHHGSLSRRIRLHAEERFKRGELRMMVATASLELGLDIGSVDLVCQIGSPRQLATAWQRVGRAGHWKGAIPKGRFFATTRDDLIECAALVRSLHEGELDSIRIPAWPRDVLAQQIVATVATGEWKEEDLFAMVRRAWPYRELPRSEFDDIVQVLSEGISNRRGRGGAYLHRDGVHRVLRPRRGARLAAITSGGAIVDNGLYVVEAEPENVPVGTLDEEFAVESHAGDIILLGTTSWKIRGIEPGRVRVENAHGAPPTVPFWKGEAPGRSLEFSESVARLRQELSDRLFGLGQDREQGTETILQWLERECGLSRLGAVQAMQYIAAGQAALGGVPTTRHVIAERFFDEAGGMQLVIHAPFGSLINKAWGMALRKRFCRGFDFELQASGSENGLVLSLSEQHSFPLETIVAFLNSRTVDDILTQAVLQAPLFQTRWRWAAARSLAFLRFGHGRKVAPQIQRMRSEDLLAAAFPMAVGCQDNHGGADLELPDHPYVKEAMRDCLTEALDLEGLREVLRRLETGAIRFSAIDTPAPSVFSHEILNAAPYSFLDDTPAEERRTRAINLRRTIEPGGSAALDAAAIDSVREEAWPQPQSADEMHDALLSLLWLPDAGMPPEWRRWVTELQLARRVRRAAIGAREGWTPAEGAAALRRAGGALLDDGPDLPEPRSREDEPASQEIALARIVRGWMEVLGPVRVADVAARLGLDDGAVEVALLRIESEGNVLRGQFTGMAPRRSMAPTLLQIEAKGELKHWSGDQVGELEWCDRRLLARIHRRTLHQLRSAVEPVSPSVFYRFLLRWQHVEENTRLHGHTGLQAVLHQLQGFEAGASSWEPQILAPRMREYEPGMLDLLCFSGEIGWARLSPVASLGNGSGRRLIPTRSSPITFLRREDAHWLLRAAGWCSDQLEDRLSGNALRVAEVLDARGACFFSDLARFLQSGEVLVKSQIEDALWELASAGVVTADGFDNLRALFDPRRRGAQGRGRMARPRHSAGRWSLVTELMIPPGGDEDEMPSGHPVEMVPEQARAELAELCAKQLLRRYGMLCKTLMTRESCAVSWYEILVACRRLEARGEIRGGRFVSGMAGEQYALPHAVEALRATRRLEPLPAPLRLSAADPLNLAGILLPGERIPAHAESCVVVLPAANGAGVIVEQTAAVLA